MVAEMNSGFCKRGEDCWFRHTTDGVPGASTSTAGASTSAAASAPTVVQAAPEDDDDDVCCICQEKPVTYGLLGERLTTAMHRRSLWLTPSQLAAATSAV